MFTKFDQLLQASQTVVVVIANNPDADSLGSALALKEILGDLQKEVHLYCGVEIPLYLRYLAGWEEVKTILVSTYDLAIMVDNSTQSLLDHQGQTNITQTLRSKPLVILDHHASQSNIDFAQIHINQPQMAATGQLIYTIAQELKWPLNQRAAHFLAASILSDSLGFTSQIMVNNATPLRVMADLVDLGVNLPQMSQKRLEWREIPAQLIAWKGELLQRIEFSDQGQIASLVVSHQDVKRFGSLFNPTVVLDEMKLVEKVKLSLGFKIYEDSRGQSKRITVRIRCYRDSQIAQDLAQTFGGGGHPYASGVKWEQGNLDFMKIKQEVLATARQLLKEEARQNETL